MSWVLDGEGNPLKHYQTRVESILDNSESVKFQLEARRTFLMEEWKILCSNTRKPGDNMLWFMAIAFLFVVILTTIVYLLHSSYTEEVASTPGSLETKATTIGEGSWKSLLLFVR